jgi:hypothetical protein
MFQTDHGLRRSLDRRRLPRTRTLSVECHRVRARIDIRANGIDGGSIEKDGALAIALSAHVRFARFDAVQDFWRFKRGHFLAPQPRAVEREHKSFCAQGLQVRANTGSILGWDNPRGNPGEERVDTRRSPASDGNEMGVARSPRNRSSSVPRLAPTAGGQECEMGKEFAYSERRV